jgi:hypothetical protein
MRKFRSILNLMIVAATFLCFSASEINANNNITNAPTVKEQLDKATKDGKAVFLLITGNGATGIDNAKKIANDAKALYSKSVVVILNKDESANSELVTKYGIARVQVPFMLVLSPKGFAVAGYPASQATADALAKAVPSAKQDEVLFAVSEKRPVFIIVSKKGLKDKATILANCKMACSKIPSKPIIVELDVNDTKETAFLKQIGVTSITDKTITIVANGSGQITGRYEGITIEATLTSSACKAGGCSPGGCGSNKSCGPKK